MRRTSPLCRVFAALATCAALAFAASPSFAGPETFVMPDGSTEVHEGYDVSRVLAAWKANTLAHERAVATATTPNQDAWDARWYDLNLTFTPSGSQVAGTVRMKATVVTGPVSTADLDFYSNLVVDGVTCAGAATTYSRSGNVLTLNLDRAYANGETFDVTVTYHGVPTAAGYFGFQTVNGRQLIWSLSESYGARTWWPCKDVPEDKPDSVDIHFTCPSALTTISNGTLVSTFVGSTTNTANWHERYPIATYLVFIAAYPYTVTQDWYRPTATDSMPIRFNNYPESVSSVAAVQAKVKDMIATYASTMGEYPFIAEKYGHAQFQFSGGMEHQTNTCIGAFNEYIVAHELMHQWWGDLVTCWDWHHIWLNEGFATYGEALWAEHTGGTSAYFADVNANAYYGAGTIYVPDDTDENRIFDSNLSYNKGGYVLHMLRHVLGDSTFFAALRAYRTQYAYASATTENFRDVCEAVSGKNLHAFFQQWIYGEYYPSYRMSWSSAAGAVDGYDVTVNVDQIQTWQLFNMPVDLTLTVGGVDTTFVVGDSLASQSFVLHVASAPSSVQLDKGGWILKTVETVVSNPTFERGILLVNGIDWVTYGTEATTAYTDKIFTGTYGYDFWDTFDTPSGGYVAALPTPKGHGAVPADVLAHYRIVIWTGNNYSGDLTSWANTPILSYLRAGGDVLLMARNGDQFLGDSLKAYLGVNWTNTSATLNDCIATRPGLSNMTLTSSQTLCSVFDTVRTTSESQLLFRVSSGFTPNRGIGAIRIPPAGMGARAIGGRFAFLSGRPYRWNHTTCKNNTNAIIATWFQESPLAGAELVAPPARLSLEPVRPNPSRAVSALRFTLPRGGRARLELLDVAGRRVRTLVDGALIAGSHDAAWDGRDDAGALAPAGLYWARLAADGEAVTQRIVRLR